MQIKETPWEIKNLGVASSAVFQFDEFDTAESLDESVLDNRDYEYQEAVVPAGNVDLLNRLLSSGFRFSELAIHIDMKPYGQLTEPLKRRLGAFSYHLADEEELRMILACLRQGDIFKTDKIATNPRFGPKVAGNRYANWAEGEIREKKAFAYVVQCKNDKIGFFVLKPMGEGVVDGLLAALFDVNRYQGFGFYVGYFLIEASRIELGAKLLIGQVSANNPSVIKVNQILGYQLRDMYYIATKLLSGN